MDESFLQRLGSKDPISRLETLREIQGAADPDLLACLIECLCDEDGTIRREARGLLKKFTKRDYGCRPRGWRDWWKDYALLRCNSCGCWLFDQTLYYKVKVRVTSEPRELVLTQEDLEKDHRAEIEKICRQMENLDPREIEEEVYVLLDYYLCLRCKKDYVRKVQSGEDQT